MQKSLTPQKKKILDFLNFYSDKKGYSPSLEEIKKKLKLKSVSTVHQHISEMEKAGFLKKRKNQKRSINVRDKISQMVRIPLLGTIAAGEPLHIFEEERESIAIPKNRIGSSSDIFALRVSGNSMIDENINNGDVILVRKQETAENGENVVALINSNEATLKKIYREKNRFRLQPANSKLEPIFTTELAIQGKVISVIRHIEEGGERKGYRKRKKD